MQYSLHCEQGSFKEMLFYNVMWYMKQNLQLPYQYNTCYYRNKSEVVENIMIYIHTGVHKFVMQVYVRMVSNYHFKLLKSVTMSHILPNTLCGENVCSYLFGQLYWYTINTHDTWRPKLFLALSSYNRNATASN